MDDYKTAIDTAILPQYIRSSSMMDRFLIAAHDENAPIERSENVPGIKTVDSFELESDAFDYFVKNKPQIEVEFFNEMCDRIGKEKTNLFCDVLSTDWYDGKSLRNGSRVQCLKSTIREYLILILRNSDLVKNVVINNESCLGANPLLTVDELKEVLNINDYMMHSHIEKLILNHQNYENLSTDDIFFRRGVDLSKEFDVATGYIEWDFINSYSISITAPEKFAQIGRNGTPAIVNGDYGLFQRRMLFFSAFVPGMDVCQLEIGVIPSMKPLQIYSQGIHANIHEYILEPTPTQRLYGINDHPSR